MRGAIAGLAGLALCSSLAAQTIDGVTLGEPIPADGPSQMSTEILEPYAYHLWQTDAGLNMSATSDAQTEQVIYLEMWRGADPDPQPSPIEGLRFGDTTRDEIVAMMGSEGIVFEERGRFEALPDRNLAVYYLTYEIEQSDAVLSLVTIQPLTEASPETAGEAILDSVGVGVGTYLSRIWGLNRGRLPGYSPIVDPF